MELDQFTLATVLGIKSFIASVIFYLLHTAVQRGSGTFVWAIASLLTGFAVLSDALQVFENVQAASLFFNIFLVSGQVLFLFGAAQFVGRPFKKYTLTLLLSLVAILTITFTLVLPDNDLRAVSLTTIYAWANAWMAWILWKHRKPHARVVYAIAAAIMFTQAAAGLIQAALALNATGVTYPPAPWIVPATIVVWINAILTIVLGSWVLFLLIMFDLVDDLKAVAEREERERIARDLHDTVLQTFQGFVMKANAMLPKSESALKDTLSRCMRDAMTAIQEGRDKVATLRAGASHLPSLHEYLRLAGEQELTPGREFILRCEEEVRTLHPLIRQELCAIGHEAIRNAFRHANARQHEVIVEYGARALILTIRDDGQGIDAADKQKIDRWGLRGIEERARLIQANVDLHTARGAGTIWRIEIQAALAYADPGRP